MERAKGYLHGGYILKILGANKEKSRNGQDMLVLSFDIVEGEYADYFTKKWKRAKEQGQDYKWGCKYYLVIGNDGYEGRLKALTTSVEKSNSGYTWYWNEESFVGKLVGGIFREEDYVINGEVRTSCKLWQVRSVETIRKGEFDIPKKKELSGDQVDALTDQKREETDRITDDDLPF